ncbi:MAG: DUF2244 domain-containing protein [Pseudomonadota bacterium]
MWLRWDVTMPYEWSPPVRTSQTLRAWPNRSLPRKGFVIFIGTTFALLMFPLLPLLGSPVLWGVLPFSLMVLTGIWWALRRNHADGRILLEVLELTPDRLTLIRRNPDGQVQSFEANPYWIRVRMHADDGPVENYLTLKSSDREVELGAFLSPDERLSLHDELCRRIGKG